jgi:hypothetical protein
LIEIIVSRRDMGADVEEHRSPPATRPAREAAEARESRAERDQDREMSDRRGSSPAEAGREIREEGV